MTVAYCTICNDATCHPHILTYHTPQGTPYFAALCHACAVTHSTRCRACDSLVLTQDVRKVAYVPMCKACTHRFGTCSFCGRVFSRKMLTHDSVGELQCRDCLGIGQGGDLPV